MNARRLPLLTLIALPLIFSTACATRSLKKEWAEKRGYSKDDMALIQETKADYYLEYQAAKKESSPQNSAPIHRVEDKFVKIFCSCYKKLGDKCRQKPEGLSGSDRALWAKANSIDWVLLTEHNPFELKPERKIDPAECP